MHEPCMVLMRSAPFRVVDRPRAMSLVTWLPPTGTPSTWTSEPPAKTAAVVEPPPMSIQAQPRSFSSSSSADRADMKGAETTPSRSRCASDRQWDRAVKAVSAMVTTSRSRLSWSPVRPRGSRTGGPLSTAQRIGSRWIGRRPGKFALARALAMARTRSASRIGRAPSDTVAPTRLLCCWPMAVVTTTPETGDSLSRSARCKAWEMASAACSRSASAPPFTPRDWT